MAEAKEVPLGPGGRQPPPGTTEWMGTIPINAAGMDVDAIAKALAAREPTVAPVVAPVVEPPPHEGG